MRESERGKEPSGSEYIEIADGLDDDNPEPKTKKVAVIWFGDVPESLFESDFSGFEIIESESGAHVSDVYLIDPARLRYGIAQEGDVFVSDFEKKISVADFVHTDSVSRLIIDPPKPKETIEDVMKRMPDPEDYQDQISGVINLRGYYNDMKSCFKDLKAAQEREENK